LIAHRIALLVPLAEIERFAPGKPYESMLVLELLKFNRPLDMGIDIRKRDGVQ